MASPRRAANSQRLLSAYVGAGIAAFGAVVLGPSLIGRDTLLSVNRLTISYPWLAHGGSDIEGHQLCTTDTIDSGMGGIHYIRQALFAGHLPNWQNVVAGGSPLGSQPDLGLLNPLALPYFVMPLWLAPAFVKLLVMIVSIGGTYLFLRRHRVYPAAALLAGFTFSVSGFMIMWTNWPQTEVAAFIPLLFWAVERLVQRGRLTDAIPIALVVAFMLLGGFPAVTGWALYAAAAYLIVRVVLLHRAERRAAWSRIGIATVGLVLGALLSAIQMLPFAESYTSSDFSYRGSLGLFPQPLYGLMTLFVPDSNGNCIAGNQVHTNLNPVELIAYVGAAAVVLMVVGAAARMRRPGVEGEHRDAAGVRAYFAIGAALVLFVGWGTTLTLQVVDHLPVFNGNPVGRIRSLLGFFIAVLAGLGFAALQRTWSTRSTSDDGAAAPDRGSAVRRDRVREAVWRVLVIGGALGLAAGVTYYSYQAATNGGFRRALADHMTLPVAFVGVTLVCVALAYLRWKPTTFLALAVVPVIVIVQGGAFFHTILPGDSKANFYPVTPTHQFLRDNLGADRYAGLGGAMYPATSLYYGLRSVTGHTFHEKEWIDLLIAVNGGAMMSPTHSQFDDTLTPTLTGHSEILDRMSVKYVVAAPNDLVGQFPPLTPGPSTVAATPASPASCQLASAAIRGVTFELAQTLYAADAKSGMTINVRLSAGGQTVSSGRYLGTGVPAGVPISVAAAAEDLPKGQPVSVQIYATGANGPLVLTASQAGQASCVPVLATQDGLKVAFAEPGAIVYQRLDAPPRVRWASSSTVVPDSTRQLVALETNSVPADQVVLGAPGPAASGQPAKVSVVTDEGGRISADVDAAGAGYLVVADALQEAGWSVEVDGKPAKLLPADHAMVAVAVPSGTHRVTLTYRAPGQVAGAALTGVAVVLLFGLGIAQRKRRAGRRSKHGSDVAFDGPGPAASGSEREPVQQSEQ